MTEEDIKGGVDSLTGKRKGFELLRDGFNLYGADAKILICLELIKPQAVPLPLPPLPTNCTLRRIFNCRKGRAYQKLFKDVARQGRLTPRQAMRTYAISSRMRWGQAILLKALRPTPPVCVC